MWFWYISCAKLTPLLPITITNGIGNVADIVCLVEAVLPLPLPLVIVPKLMVMVIVMVLCAKLRQGLLDG